jgi:hypothetical protein
MGLLSDRLYTPIILLLILELVTTLLLGAELLGAWLPVDTCPLALRV